MKKVNLVILLTVGLSFSFMGFAAPKDTLVERVIAKHKSEFQYPGSTKVRNVFLAKRTDRKLYVCGESNGRDTTGVYTGYKKFIAVGYVKFINGSPEVTRIVTLRKGWLTSTAYLFNNMQKNVCAKKSVVSAR